MNGELTVIAVGDLVRVHRNEVTSPRGLACRYGYVTELVNEPDGAAVVIEFADFSAKLGSVHVEIVLTPCNGCGTRYRAKELQQIFEGHYCKTCYSKLSDL